MPESFNARFSARDSGYWCSVALFAFVVGACAGCAASRPLVSHPRPGRLPGAADLHAALSARREGVHSLRALAHLRYRGPDESNSSREALVVERPDRLRVEVLSMFGPVFTLTADAGTLTAYARQERTVYQGAASPANLWRYARIALPVRDIVDIVLGSPPVRQGSNARVSFDDRLGRVRLYEDLDGGAAQSVWFDEEVRPVAAEERAADGHPYWQARFDAYEPHGGIPVATRIGLELPGTRSVEIVLEDVDVNPPLENSVFALHVPPGSKIVDLDPVLD